MQTVHIVIYCIWQRRFLKRLKPAYQVFLSTLFGKCAAGHFCQFSCEILVVCVAIGTIADKTLVDNRIGEQSEAKMSDSKTESKVDDWDLLWERIGPFGKWQLGVTILLSFISRCGFFNLSFIINIKMFV